MKAKVQSSFTKAHESNTRFKDGEGLLKTMFIGISNLPEYRYLFEPRAIEIYEDKQSFCLNVISTLNLDQNLQKSSRFQVNEI